MAEVELRLIGTTDLHAHLHPYDYYRDAPSPRVGLAKAATLALQARGEAKNALLFDNGDWLQGSPMGDWAAGALSRSEIAAHPMIAAMNAIRYDAATVGNHEFNYGLDTLDRALAGAEYPIVCGNVFHASGEPYFAPYTILEREVTDLFGETHVLRVGVAGFVTPQIVRWDRLRLAGRVVTRSIVETAREILPRLRERADVVVALCHAGVARAGGDAEENAGLLLAELGLCDAIFVGHQHLLLPGPDFEGVAGVDAKAGALAGVPAVMAGFWGSHVGVIDIALTREDARWGVSRAKVELRAIAAETAPDAATLAATASAHQATLTYARAPVGELEAPLASYFAMIGDDASVRIVNDAQLWFVRGLAAEIPALGESPLLSASAPFKCGGRGGVENYTRVAAGPIALKNVADLYVFPNSLSVVKVNGAIVRDWLERAASVFLQLDPGADGPQPLLDGSFAAYDFDTIAGLEYRIDPTAPARHDAQGQIVAPDARRICDLRFEGRPLDDAATFLIATNSYRASGGGHFPGCDGASVVYASPDANQDVLRRYVAAQTRVRPSAQPAWRFSPWPASVVATLLAPPEAEGFPPPPGVIVRRLGPAADGFALIQVIPSEAGEQL